MKSPKRKADSRAPGSGQHLELGVSEKAGDQEPTSALGHGQGGRGKKQHPAEADERAKGLCGLLVTRLQEEFKPHRHYTGLEAVAHCRDFTSTSGTAACECAIAERPVI